MSKHKKEATTAEVTLDKTAEAGGDAPPKLDTDPAGAGAIAELKAKAAKADEHWDRFVRLSADFDNFKKRAAREKQETIQFANQTLLQKLIPVLDNLEMALSAALAGQNGSEDSLKTGLTMVNSQFKSALAECGLEEIDATNKLFDPNWHEAVSQQETAEVPEGQVVQQLRKGYKIKERLIRPAQVIVARKPAA